MSAAHKLEPAGTLSDDAFTFVRALASELSGGKVELPGFPEVVLRVQRVLSDESADMDRVVRVIGSEPTLAGRLMQMANSVALNPGHSPVTELRAAVSRVGLNIVRSATIATAVQQIRSAATLRGLEKQLDVMWKRSVQISSLSFVICAHLTRLNRDEAMLAGLLQGIGRLYILTRASGHRGLFADLERYNAIERDWHLGIAGALLENWEISDAIVSAVRESEDFDREPRGSASLADVIIAANVLATYQDRPKELEAQIKTIRPLARMNFNAAVCEALLHESADEIRSIRKALS